MFSRRACVELPSMFYAIRETFIDVVVADNSLLVFKISNNFTIYLLAVYKKPAAF